MPTTMVGTPLSPIDSTSPTSQPKFDSSCGLRLNVSSNRLPLVRLIDLVEPLRDCLTALDASQNDLGDAAPQSLLRTLPVLRELHLSGCGVGSQGISSCIAELRLHAKANIGSRSTGADPKSLRKNGLRSSPKSIANGSSTGKLLRSPRTCKRIVEEADPGLQILDLSACSVEVAVPELSAYLAEAGCTLTALDLSFNVMGPEALRHLGQGLRANSTLRSLRLAHCHLREDAAALFENFGAEGSSCSFQHLCLARNNLSGSAYKELGRFLSSSAGKRLESLDVSGNTLSDEFASRCLGRALIAAKGAKMRLDISGTRQFFDSTFARWDVTTSHVLAVLKLPTCRVLEVVLDQCTMLPEAAASTLARTCLNVRVFSFSGHAIGEAFAHALSELMKAIAASSFTRSSQSSTSPTSVVRSVALDGAEGGSPGDSVAVEGDNVSSSPQSHRGLRLCLCELRLNDAALQDHSIALLGDALVRLRDARQDGHDLEVLEVAGNHLTADSLEALGPMLVENVQLRLLVLSRNRLKAIGAARISELLPWRHSRATSSLELGLRHCSLTSEGVVQVWQTVLSDDAKVAAIDLAENALDNDGLQAMHELATSRPKHGLKQVNLLPNPCNTADVVALLRNLTPWQRISVHEGPLEAATVGQLLYGLGSEQCSDVSKSSPGRQSPDKSSNNSASPRAPQEVPPPYVLSLSGTSMVSKHWQWGIIADAMKTAPTPAGADAGTRRFPRSSGAPWRRFGGVGAELVVELDRCDLARAAFKVPTSIPVVVAPSEVSSSLMSARPSSLAKSARKEIRTRFELSRTSQSDHALPCSLAARARSAGSLGRGTSLSSIGGDQEAWASPSSTCLAVFENGESVRSEGASPEDRFDLVSQEARLMSESQSRCSLINLGRRSRSATNVRSGRPMNPHSDSVVETVPIIAIGTSSGSRQTVPDQLPTNNGYPSRKVQQQWAEQEAQGWAIPLTRADAHGQPRVQKLDGAIGRSFERKGHQELEVSTVLRELRSVESIHLESCGLSDRWLAQLCSTGGSSKWSGVRSLDLRRNDLTAGCCQALASVVSGGLEALNIDGNRIRAEGLETLCLAIKCGGRCCLRSLSVADNEIGHPGGFVAAELLSRKSGCPLQAFSLARNPLLSSGELIAIFRAICRQAESSGGQVANDQATERSVRRPLEVLDLTAAGADALILPQLSRALIASPTLTVYLRGCPALNSTASASPELLWLASEGRVFL